MSIYQDYDWDALMNSSMDSGQNRRNFSIDTGQFQNPYSGFGEQESFSEGSPRGSIYDIVMEGNSPNTSRDFEEDPEEGARDLEGFDRSSFDFRMPQQDQSSDFIDREGMMDFVKKYGGYGAAVPFLAAGLGGLFAGTRKKKK